MLVFLICLFSFVVVVPVGHAPKHLHDELTEDYRDMIYAATAAEVETRRKAFLRKWRLKCRAVADSLEEAGERLFAFTRLDPSQWQSARTTNAIERLFDATRHMVDELLERFWIGEDGHEAVRIPAFDSVPVPDLRRLTELIGRAGSLDQVTIEAAASFGGTSRHKLECARCALRALVGEDHPSTRAVAAALSALHHGRRQGRRQ